MSSETQKELKFDLARRPIITKEVVRLDGQTYIIENSLHNLLKESDDLPADIEFTPLEETVNNSISEYISLSPIESNTKKRGRFRIHPRFAGAAASLVGVVLLGVSDIIAIAKAEEIPTDASATSIVQPGEITASAGATAQAGEATNLPKTDQKTITVGPDGTVTETRIITDGDRTIIEERSKTENGDSKAEGRAKAESRGVGEDEEARVKAESRVEGDNAKARAEKEAKAKGTDAFATVNTEAEITDEVVRAAINGEVGTSNGEAEIKGRARVEDGDKKDEVRGEEKKKGINIHLTEDESVEIIRKPKPQPEPQPGPQPEPGAEGEPEPKKDQEPKPQPGPLPTPQPGGSEQPGPQPTPDQPEQPVQDVRGEVVENPQAPVAQPAPIEAPKAPVLEPRRAPSPIIQPRTGLPESINLEALTLAGTFITATAYALRKRFLK